MSLAVGIDAGEDLQTFFLRGDKTVLLVFLVGMCPDEFVTRRADGLGQIVFQFFLFGPAVLIGRQAQIAAGHQ